MNQRLLEQIREHPQGKIYEPKVCGCCVYSCGCNRYVTNLYETGEIILRDCTAIQIHSNKTWSPFCNRCGNPLLVIRQPDISCISCTWANDLKPNPK